MGVSGTPPNVGFRWGYNAKSLLYHLLSPLLLCQSTFELLNLSQNISLSLSLGDVPEIKSNAPKVSSINISVINHYRAANYSYH